MYCFDARDNDASTPKRFEAEYRSGDPFDSPVVLLDDVVQVFTLAQNDIDASVSLDVCNGGRVRAALVDSDLLGHVVQVDGPFQKAPRRSQIALGGEKEVDRVAIAIDCAVKIFPVTSHLDVGLVHAPASTNGALASTKHGGQHRQHLDRPSMHCGVVHENTALLHHLLNVAQAQRVGHVPAYAGQHDLQRIVQPFEDLAQGAIDQTFAEIKHGQDCRLCLLRQNRFANRQLLH